MNETLHFDPVNLAVVLGGIVVFWYKFFRAQDVLIETTKGHDEWMKVHQKECNESKKQVAECLSGIRETNVRLTTMVDGTNDRIERIEHRLDRVNS